MKHSVLFLVCSMLLFPWDITCFQFIKKILFPQVPMVTRVRSIENYRALSNQFAVFDTVGLVEQYGYLINEHQVTTVDGYKIIFFRIYASPISPKKKGKPVIFLQHGLFASSDAFVLFGPGKDLAFLLADEGYDVWIGNLRGNSYGRSHSHLSPLSSAFWNFSFHEHAVYDLPRMIDYVIEVTGEETLTYVGHSMGTTMIFVLLSEMPEYNDRIRLALCLAPVAFWKVPANLIFRLSADNHYLIRKIFDDNKIYEFAPQTTNNARFGRALCSDGAPTQYACGILWSILAGDDPDQLNSTALPHILSYFPAGGSTGVLYHYQQNIRSGAFQKFDLGSVRNSRLYGQVKPPMYNVKKISAPIALIYGKNDVVSIEPNINELAKRLENVVTFEAVPYDTFNHFDFLWAKDAKKLLYSRLMEIVKIHQ